MRRTEVLCMLMTEVNYDAIYEMIHLRRSHSLFFLFASLACLARSTYSARTYAWAYGACIVK